MTTAEQEFAKAIAPKFPALRGVLYEYSFELKDHVAKDFTVTPAWRDEFYKRLEAAKIVTDRKQYDAATPLVNRWLSQQVARLAFGDSTAFRRTISRRSAAAQGARAAAQGTDAEGSVRHRTGGRSTAVISFRGMRNARQVITAVTLVAAVACHGGAAHPAQPAPAPSAAPRPAEPHLANIRQLTYGGENAEAYFSADGKRLIFQSTRDGRTLRPGVRHERRRLRRAARLDGTRQDDLRLLLRRRHEGLLRLDARGRQRVPAEARSVQGLRLGARPVRHLHREPRRLGTQRLTNYGVYTAEGTLSPDGKTIVFTSLKDGDLDIYTMNVDGSNMQRLTNTPGYDGGPFWSPDGKRIVYRAWHPTDHRAHELSAICSSSDRAARTGWRSGS